jgi:hypothetical protein
VVTCGARSVREFHSSGHFSMIEVEHSTQSLPAFYSTNLLNRAIRTLQRAIL